MSADIENDPATMANPRLTNRRPRHPKPSIDINLNLTHINNRMLFADRLFRCPAAAPAHEEFDGRAALTAS
jgi:hypothetical protein